MKIDMATQRIAQWMKVFVVLCPVLFVGVSQQESRAQGTAEGTSSTASSLLTVEYLIGDAVSLSSKSYPEIEKAIQRFKNSDGVGAREFLKKAEAKYPKLPPADVLLAKMQVLVRNNRAVLALLDSAAKDYPEDPEAYLILGDVAYQSQRTTDAVALFEYAAPLIEKFSGNTKRKRNFDIRLVAGRSAVAIRRGDWERASELLAEWISIDPTNATAYSRLGGVLYRLDKPKEALAQFKKARENNAKSPHPYVSLGQLFSADDNLEMARKSYEKAYNEDKADENVAQAYAEWLIQQGKLDQAKDVAAALRKQTPDALNALLLDGIVSYMQGESERAEQALQKVLSLDPRNAQATNLLALLLIQSDDVADKERALQYAQLNQERFSNNAQANVTKAWVLYELGRKAEAQQSLQQAGRMKIQPDSTYLIAKIFVGEGQNERAMQALEQIVAQKTGLVVFRREAEELLAQLKAGGSGAE